MIELSVHTMTMLTLTTCQSYPTLPENLEPLVKLLSSHVPIHITPWQTYPQTDFILPICAWDYSESPQQFEHWLNQAQHSGSQFINPIELIKWNMKKSYLCDLAANGHPIIPTYILAPQAPLIYQTMQQNQWDTAVIKPLIGQSGNHVSKVHLNQPLPNLSTYHHGIVLQPFVTQIQTLGETSLIFFHGHYSHAIQRQPAPQEWRANSRYGVQTYPAYPSQQTIDAAQAVLYSLPQMPTYARIDGIIQADSLLINELEVIEPALYLNQVPHGSQYFAQAILSYMTPKSLNI